MHKLILLFLLSANICYATPLQGYVSNPPVLCKQHPKLDKRGKPLIGHLSYTNLRGFIGIAYNRQTGQITYIYAQSDLNHFGIKAGDYIVKIDKELYLPCLMPNVVIYPNGYILNLTIRSLDGKIKTIPVKLIPADSTPND